MNSTMKRYTILAMALGTFVFFWSCSSDKSSENTQRQQAVDTPAPVMMAGNGTFHYVCPQGCGGGAAQGTCPTCGSQYVHNAAYHANQQQSTTPNVPIPAQGPLADPNAARVQPGQVETQTMAAGGSQQHYICPNGCAGSGGEAQGNCPTCGSAYVHNAAYHSQSAESTSTTVDPSQAQSASPAQNAAGEYHYTCTNGCAGGSGSAGSCATCGAPLAHNSAYHQ